MISLLILKGEVETITSSLPRKKRQGKRPNEGVAFLVMNRKESCCKSDRTISIKIKLLFNMDRQNSKQLTFLYEQRVWHWSLF